MITLMLALAMIASEPADGATAPLPASKPQILAHPDGGRMAKVFPKQAWKARVGGRATLECLTKADNTLENCKVLSETPEGMGFGEAALELARYYRIKSIGADGQPEVGRTVRVPVSWSAPPAD